MALYETSAAASGMNDLSAAMSSSHGQSAEGRGLMDAASNIMGSFSSYGHGHGGHGCSCGDKGGGNGDLLELLAIGLAVAALMTTATAAAAAPAPTAGGRRKRATRAQNFGASPLDLLQRGVETGKILRQVSCQESITKPIEFSKYERHSESSIYFDVGKLFQGAFQRAF